VSNSGESSVRALVLSPTGRDNRLIATMLHEMGVAADICADVTELAHELERGAGLAIIANEALKEVSIAPLERYLLEQGEWSDLPVILLTLRGGLPGRDPELTRLAEMLGNVSFLERPFHIATLASMVHAARRQRQRQYTARARHIEIIEREQQLQTALTAGRLGAWSLDVEADGLRLEASETSHAHFGRRPDEPFTYADLVASVHSGDAERRNQAINRALATGDDYIAEFRNIWPDGSEHWMDVRARAITDANGQVTRMVGVSSDITSRKITELERERLVSELAAERTALSNLTRTLEHRVAERTSQLSAEIATREKTQYQLLQSQKMESVGQLTGGIAHDFNNLLMAIMGSLELLRKKLPEEPAFKRLIDGAMQGATRGASLTQRMLAFARQQELRTVAADLGGLIGGMQELLQRSIGPQIALTIHVAHGLPAAVVDPHQVELAVLNLAINARDAMPDGGAIDIQVREESVGAGHVAQLKPGRYLCVQVSDTGTGMDAQTLAKAIEPFFSTKPAGKGTGLGLSMTHGLAQQLGGGLGLVSHLGSGTTASLWLPVAAVPVAPAPPPDAKVAVNRTARILLVDDDPLVAMSTADMLTDLGHAVTEANSGERALKWLDSGLEVDLMVTDQAMPGMSGIELAELVRKRRPGLPVLLATGYADLPACQLAKLPRLAKPYQQAQLQAAIEELLAAASPALLESA
jgi:signal transduction histidine kinase/ActR/RegA family two-component response regulator